MVNILNAIFATTPGWTVHNTQQSSDIVILRPRGQQNKTDPFSSPQNRIMTCAQYARSAYHQDYISLFPPGQLNQNIAVNFTDLMLVVVVVRDLPFQLLAKSKLSAV